MYKTIEFSQSDGIARIELARPDEGHAMSLPLLEELHDTALHCDERRDVRAVLLTASGRSFSVGGDLKPLAEAGPKAGALIKRMTGHLHRTISIFQRMEKPLVVAVNGTAAGAGFSLMLMGDVVLAADGAKFTLAYSAVGLAPDGGSTYILPRLVGPRRAKELMLTNRVLSAQEALDYGLIDRVVPAADLRTEAEAQSRALADGPTGAFASVKRLVASSFSENLESQMELEARAIHRQVTSAEGQEGIAAFLEKRKANFSK